MGVNAVSWAPYTKYEDISVYSSYLQKLILIKFFNCCKAEEQTDNLKNDTALVSCSCDKTVKVWVYNSNTKIFEEIKTLGKPES